MQGIVIRTLITMAGLYVASAIVPGVSIHGAGSFLVAAILLGLLNAFVRPFAILMTLPITIVTLGFFLLVLNAALFGLVAAMLTSFVVTGFWSALFGALVVGITSTFASWFIGADGKVEVYVIRSD